MSQPSAVRFWHLTAIGQYTSTASMSGQGVTVALIDTGVDGSHPDLAGRVSRAYRIGPTGLTPADPAADEDFRGHGTRMARLICAAHEAGGVAPGVRLISLRYPDRSDNYSRLFLALLGVVNEIARGGMTVGVVNLSGGSDRLTLPQQTALRDLITRLQQLGILFVAAVGNQQPDTSLPPQFPATMPPPMIAVGPPARTVASGLIAVAGRHPRRRPD
jgi:subtilisin family serine protease